MTQWRIKLHRSSQDNEMYFLEPFTKRQAWQDLILTTNHKDWKIIVRWNIIDIKRWENWYSEDTLSTRWKWSRGKVRRYLNYLETIQQIVQHKSKVKSTITIVKYSEYQKNDTTDDTTDGHQTVQQTDTNKNDKKKKNDKQWKEINNKDNTIVLEQAPTYWNKDINDVLEKIKMYNNWIVDWTVKEQRQYWKMLLTKINKIESVENWKYKPADLLEIILKIISKNEYHSHKIVWPKKIYYDLAWLMQVCKQEIQKEEKTKIPFIPWI